jgi:hypothetical protein
MKWISFFTKRLKNQKGHFILPALGAAAKVVGTGALAAGKAAGGAALAGAKAVGTGALTAGKAIGTGAMKVGSGIGKAAGKMLGMGGGGMNPGTQVASIGGNPVTYGQTAQGAGMSMNPGGVMQGGASSGSNKMLDTIKNALKKITGKGEKAEEKKAEEKPAQPSLIGGEGGFNTQMPQFTRPPSMGALIAQMLQAKRGY